MTERAIYVDREEGWTDAYLDQWAVYDDNDWLASFRKKEDADEWAEQKRLEP